MRLVDACNRRGRSAATGVRSRVEADVAGVVVRVGARDRTRARARAVVAVRARGDELNTTENRGTATDRRGDSVGREVYIHAHITENRGARGREESQGEVIGRTGVSESPADKVIV